MLNIRKGGHKDLEHYFTLIEMDFDSEEIIPRIAIHKGIMNGSIEMLVAYDEDSGMDAGYALVLTEFEDPDPDRLKKLRRFFARFGYEEIVSDYSISGVKANLLVKPIKGKTDITPIAYRIIPDMYSRFLTGFTMDRMLDIRPVK